jgi:hypothetical protein
MISERAWLWMTAVFICAVKPTPSISPPCHRCKLPARGSYDAFVSKLNKTTGALLFSTYLGGTLEDGANAIATDGGGNAFVVGYTLSSDFPLVRPVQGYSGNKDIFVAKISTAFTPPSLDFSTFVGGSGDDIGTAVVVQVVEDEHHPSDSFTSIMLTGSTTSPNFPVSASTDGGRGFAGGTDAFVVDIFYFWDTATANYVSYSTCWGGSGNDYGTGILRSFMGCLVTGTTNSPDFPRLNSTQVPAGSYDVFLADLSRYGHNFSTLLGGKSNDFGNALDRDSLGNIYVVGHTQSSDFPLSRPLYWGLRGASDAFVAKFSSSGKLLMNTLLGGSSYEYGYGIAIDSADNVWVTGETASADFPKQRPLQSYSAGSDVFISKLSFQSRTDFALIMLFTN